MSELHLHIHVPSGSIASFDGETVRIVPVASNSDSTALTSEQLKQIAEYLDARKAEATG